MNLTSYIQKVKVLFQNLHSEETNPRRDWTVLMVLVVLSLIASVGWNANYFFEVVESGDVISSESSTFETNASSVSKVEERFRERMQEAQKYENETLFVDPSK